MLSEIHIKALQQD